MSHTKNLKIGILGAGHIGKNLARALAQAGHDVKVANSRGPEAIEESTLAFGARAVTGAEAVQGVDVVIVSIPLYRIPDVAPLIATLPEEAVVIDTSNYYPVRDNTIMAIEAGQAESLWVAHQLGRPIVKAWNTISSASLVNKATAPGTLNRIALPVAAAREMDRQIAFALVEDTGFDALDAGTLDESWRQQPGTPCYGADLTAKELASALAMAKSA